MTGANFYTYVLAVLKRTDKSTEVYQAMTDVVMDMRLRFHSEDFKTISSNLTGCSAIGDYSLTLPTDFGHLISNVEIRDNASDEDYVPLEKISIGKYKDLYSSRLNTSTSNRDTGTPIHFCVFGGDILVGPPVDKTSYKFKITYTTEDATEIASGTSSVPFTDRYRKTVRYGVLKEIYLLLENYEEATVWSELYEVDIQKIIDNDYSNVRDDNPISYNGI